jgi:succinate dehydrogenase/fumarate reductase cytochrome b subunit
MITSTMHGMNGIEITFSDFCSVFETHSSLKVTAVASAAIAISFLQPVF